MGPLTPLETLAANVLLVKDAKPPADHIESIIADELFHFSLDSLSPLARIAYDIALEKTYTKTRNNQPIKRKCPWPVPFPEAGSHISPEVKDNALLKLNKLASKSGSISPEYMDEIHHNLRILALYWSARPTKADESSAAFSRDSFYYGKIRLDDIITAGIFLHDLLGDGKVEDMRISIQDLRKELKDRILEYNRTLPADDRNELEYSPEEISRYIGAVTYVVNKLDRKTVFDKMGWLAHKIELYSGKDIIRDKYTLKDILGKAYQKTVMTNGPRPSDPDYVYSEQTENAMYISDFVRLLTGNWQRPEYLNHKKVDWALMRSGQGIDFTETPLGREEFGKSADFIRQNQIFREESPDERYHYIKDVLSPAVFENNWLAPRWISGQNLYYSILSHLLAIRSEYLLDDSLDDIESMKEIEDYVTSELHTKGNGLPEKRPDISEKTSELVKKLGHSLEKSDLIGQTNEIIRRFSDIFTAIELGIGLTHEQVRFREKFFLITGIDINTRESVSMYSKYTKMKGPNEDILKQIYDANILDICANTVKYFDVPDNLGTLRHMDLNKQAAQIGKYMSGDAAALISWHDQIYIPKEFIDPHKYFNIIFQALKTSFHGRRIIDYLNREFDNYDPVKKLNALSGGIPLFMLDRKDMAQYIHKLEIDANPESGIPLRIEKFKRSPLHQALNLNDVQKVIYFAVAPQLKGYQNWMLAAVPPNYYLDDAPRAI